MPDIKLKECPFCGSNDVELKTTEVNNGYTHYFTHHIGCNNCGVRTKDYDFDGYYGVIGNAETIEDAVNCWNRRK